MGPQPAAFRHPLQLAAAGLLLALKYHRHKKIVAHPVGEENEPAGRDMDIGESISTSQ